MAGAGDSKAEYDRLQDALMRRLDAIEADIDAGRTSVEEGSTLANTLIDGTRAKSTPLLAARIEQSQRTTRRSRLAVVVEAAAFVAYLAFRTWVAVSG
ncbi:hypothetical protein [Xanthomonas medicagonis]|uniref:hypothetical protein n=1 Tax=Xanthomonas medicagonis TaxID=3160841 RepID=UPI0035155CBE